MNKQVCAVIVTYNRIGLLKKCLEAIDKQSYPCDVFVVDNHSEDGTKEFLREKGYPFISLKENSGGAGGFNAGLRNAAENGYAYIWMMDDDCVPYPDALEKLMCAAEKVAGFGYLASRVLWTDGNDHAMNRITRKGDLFIEHVYPIRQATFVSFLISRDTVLKCGLPIRDFFIWGDDIEYSRRIAVRHQIPSYYVEDSIVVHMTRTNIGSKIAYDESDDISRYYYAYRNENYLYRQEGFRGSIYYHAKCAYNAMRIVFKAKDRKWERLRILFSAMRDGYSFDPEVEYLR